MNKILSCVVAMLSVVTVSYAQTDTIDISGNNTSSSYVTYEKALTISATKTVDVLMARYAYFNSKISGNGTLRLHAGGERCYLGTAKGASYPDWTMFKGDVHIFPYKENSPSAGFYGVVMAHGGKTFSVEDVEGSLKGGKVNIMMQNNRVTLHEDAVLVCESGTRGFRFGELQTLPGSLVQGYIKKGSYNSYFLVGCLDTDAELAGKIAPPDYSDQHRVGLVKEGTGTYRLSGNENFISGALRILDGRVLVVNDRAVAEAKKLRGATGGMQDSANPVVFVFEKGVLGGTGNVGGTVDNYGVVEPGDDGVGSLCIRDFTAQSRAAHLYVRPASVLRFKVASANSHDQLMVGGDVRYYNICQDFSTSDKMPAVQVVLDEAADVKVGDEFVLMTAKGKSSMAGDWHFDLLTPGKYTWELVERESEEGFSWVLRLVSLEDEDPNTHPDDEDDDDQQGKMGAYYDDGIDDKTDMTSLREYAERNDKWIGTAISTWKSDITNENLPITRETGRQFSLLEPENEMKFDALQPSQGQFSFGAADNLVRFAERHEMVVRGHCLAWHSQLPQWVSSDGKKNDKNWTRAQALDILRNHINAVVGHFKGKVKAWDVVNECLDDDQVSVRANPDGYDLRTTVWTRAIGEDFIDSAFVYAHRADPEALLYLNDYGVEFQGKAKSMAFYNLALRLKKDGIPIHGVGLQCHLSIGEIDSVKLERTIRMFADAGLKCVITELDMGIPSTTTVNLEEQARCYRVVTDIVLNNDNCPYFIIWGVKDNDSWRDASYPLLYDAGLGKKPAFYAVRSALRHRALLREKDGVAQVRSEGNSLSEVTYDIYGRRMPDGHLLPPGIYVRGGRKMVVPRR